MSVTGAWRVVAAALSLAALTGCAGNAPVATADGPAGLQLPPAGTTFAEQAARIPPTITQAQARKTIAANRGRMFKDPDSIKDARIGDPFTCLTGSGNCICIEANGRNSYGGFTGVQLFVLEFPSPDRVEMIGAMNGPESCGRLVPMPELNGRR